MASKNKRTRHHKGSKKLIAELERFAKETGKKANLQLAKDAKEIAEFAKEFVPIDYGDLESAIKVMKTEQGRDAKGRFTSCRHIVGVDVDQPVKNPKKTKGGKTQLVGDYALYVHEVMPVPPGDFFAMGEYADVRGSQFWLQGGGRRGLVQNIGPRTRAEKPRGGGQYMTRAFWQVNNGFNNAISRRIKEIVLKEVQDLKTRLHEKGSL